MCDINLDDTNAYAKADLSQLEKYNKTKKHVFLISSITNENIRNEMERFIRMRCEKLALLTLAKDISRYERVAEFLNQYCKDNTSICDWENDELERKFQVFLLQNGLVLSQNRKRKDRKKDEKQRSDKLTFLLSFYRFVLESNELGVPETEKDIWDIRKLDVMPENNPINPLYTMDFTVIKQDEIRRAVKAVLYEHCSYKSCTCVKSEIGAMGKLSEFLYNNYAEIDCLEQLTRDIVEEFIIYLKTGTGLSTSSYNSVITYVGGVLADWGAQTDNTELGMLFVKGDFKAKRKKIPEFYTDTEIKRFNEALTGLEPQIMRCLVLHQILGTRIGEVLMLRSDCLSEKNGRSFVEIYQSKVHKHYKKPVKKVVADLIRTALSETQKLYPDTEYVFLQDNGSTYTYSMLMYRINSMILELELKDDRGDLFVFKSHKFRHTYGIKHAESNVDDKHLADLLGHQSTRSVQNYRMIRNDKLAEATKGVREEINNVIRETRRENNGKV